MGDLNIYKFASTMPNNAVLNFLVSVIRLIFSAVKIWGGISPSVYFPLFQENTV